jgi:hypothetical protein
MLIGPSREFVLRSHGGKTFLTASASKAVTSRFDILGSTCIAAPNTPLNFIPIVNPGSLNVKAIGSPNADGDVMLLASKYHHYPTIPLEGTGALFGLLVSVGRLVRPPIGNRRITECTNLYVSFHISVLHTDLPIRISIESS